MTMCLIALCTVVHRFVAGEPIWRRVFATLTQLAVAFAGVAVIAGVKRMRQWWIVPAIVLLVSRAFLSNHSISRLPRSLNCSAIASCTP